MDSYGAWTDARCGFRVDVVCDRLSPLFSSSLCPNRTVEAS